MPLAHVMLQFAVALVQMRSGLFFFKLWRVRLKTMPESRKNLRRVSTTLYFLPAYSPELNRIEMVWKQMKYNWRDFKVMKADQIERWVGQISKGFGNEYMFTF